MYSYRYIKEGSGSNLIKFQFAEEDEEDDDNQFDLDREILGSSVSNRKSTKQNINRALST
jgi:hypothetical protein